MQELYLVSFGVFLRGHDPEIALRRIIFAR